MSEAEPDLRRDWPRHALMLGLLAVFAFVVLTLAFLRVIEGLEPTVVGDTEAVPNEWATPGGPGDGAPEDGDEGGTDDEPSVGGADAEDDDPPVEGLSQPEDGEGDDEGEGEGAPDEAEERPPASAVAPDPDALPLAPEGFTWARDGQLGLRVQVPEDWRQAVPSPDELSASYAADYDLIYEAPDGSERLAFSAWEAEGRAPLLLFVPSVAEGMRSVGGEQPFNAGVSGHPAMLLGGDESPTTPMRYGTFLEREGRYLRVAWATYDGDPDASVYQRALATLHWAEDTVQGANTAPPVRLPAGLYFGSDRLFGDPYP